MVNQEIKNTKIVSILMAAGISKRMPNDNKLLKNLGGKPVIRHAVEALLQSVANNVFVVTGYDSGRVQEALSDLPISFVNNPNYASGMASSLCTGLTAVPANAIGILVALGDMPLIQVSTINSLIKKFIWHKNNIVCRPVFSGKPGHPVLWPKVLFPELLKLSGDQGGSFILKDASPDLELIPVNDSSIHQDIDTLEDLKKLKLYFQ